MTYPPWVAIHVPHDSTDVPPAVREQFLLNEEQLADELDRITDHHTHASSSVRAASATPGTGSKRQKRVVVAIGGMAYCLKEESVSAHR